MSDVLYGGFVDDSNIPQLDAHGFLLDPSNPASGLVGTTINGLPVWSAMQTAQHLLRDNANWCDIHPNLALSYSFGDPAVWTAGSGFLAFDARGQQAALQAMQLYADVSGVTFYQSADLNAADITFRYIEGGQNGGGWAMFPWPGGVTVNVNNVSWEPVVTAGTYSLNLELHELGHAMGLDHPGDYNGSTAVYADADHFNDSEQYTNMSYWGTSYTGGHIAASVATLGLHDILAIQMAYGINWSTRAGDTTYGFHATAGLNSYDFLFNHNMGFSIWDGGGTDTLDFSGFVGATVLDLRQGSFSSTDNGTYNVSIAYGAVIEDAVGGHGNDKIHGNDVGNFLDGGSGDDVIFGGEESAAAAASNPRDFTGIRLNYDPKVANQYLEVAHLANTPTTAFTLEMLVDLDRLGAGAAFATLSPAYGLEFEVVNNIVQATVQGAVYSTGYNVERIIDGNAHRLSLSWNSGDGAIGFYVDGALASSGTIAQGASLAANGRLVIGQDQNYYGSGFASGREFDGTVGDVRLFNDVRTAQEIADNAFTRLTGSEQGLVHNWQVTSGSTSIADAVAGGQALAVVNGGTLHDTAPVIATASDNDTLVGGAGSDSLHGGAGDDTLVGDDLSGHVDTGIVDLVHLNKTNAGGGLGDAELQGAAFAMPSSALTFEMVLRLDSPLVYAARMISYGDNAWDGYGTQDFTLRADLNNSKYELVIGGQSFDTGLALSTTFLDGGSRLSITWDQPTGAVAIYLDGLLFKSGTVGAGAVLPATATLDVVDGSYQVVKGAIGDIRVWDHVRTAAEIAQDAMTAYTSSAGKAGLIADWQASSGTPGSLANIVSGSPIGALSVINTTAGNPALFESVDFAARFRDTLDGGAGDDILRGGQGDDILAGGAGNDTADWSDASGNVAFTLSASGDGTFFNAATGTDTYTSIENVTLGTGNDTLTGNGGDNVLKGGGGSDTIDGAGGIDTVVYDGARSDFAASRDAVTHAITIRDLRAGAPEGTDTITNVETFKFSDGAISAAALVNVAPVVTAAVADQATNEDAAFTFTLPAGTFTDGDGDPLTLTATRADGTALPVWLSFDATSRTFSGTPANGDVGTLHLKVTATDPINASASDTFDVVVANVNDAPALVAAIADRPATEDTAFTFTLPAGTFVDIDAGDTLALSATKSDGSALPAWLSFNAATRTFSGTPANGDVGTVHLKVTATDGSNATASDTFDVVVANVNDAPLIATPISLLVPATEDTAFTSVLPSGMFIDIDAGDTLTYSVSLADGSALPAWLSFDAASRTLSGTPANGDVGTLQLKVVATDTAGAFASQLITLPVINTNDAPVLVVAAADQTATAGSLFTYKLGADAFADVDAGDSLTFSTVKADGSPLPAWLSFDAATGTFSGTPANGDAGTVDILVRATDSAGAHADDEFIVTVDALPVVASPIAGTVSIANASVVEGNAGTTSMIFTATRTGGTLPFDVTYATRDGVAMVQDNDYVAAAGTLHFAEGATTAAVSVTVNGDLLREGDQSFFLTLESTTGGATIGNAVAVGTILTDDTAAPTHSVAIAKAAATTHAGAADDLVSGTTGNDTIYGDAGNDTVFAGKGVDSLYGGDGADTLVGNADIFAKEHDVIDGGAGDDTLYGEYTDTISGGAGFDILYAVNAYDWAIDLGASSIELMIADFGNDTINASTQTCGVEIVASGGNDIVTGSSFNDRLWGGVGNDTIDGGAGDDMLFGDVGADKLSAGAGNDVLYVDSADTVVNGGDGFDVVYITNGGGMTIDMNAQGVEFVIDLAGGNDVVTAAGMAQGVDIYTSSGNDTITGSANADCLWGGAGSDFIKGGDGADLIVGGAGADTIDPGAGADRIYLNAGSGGDGAADRVVVGVDFGSDLKTVYDFEHGVDKIDCTAMHLTFADLAITATGNGAAHVHAGAITFQVDGLGGVLDQNDFAF